MKRATRNFELDLTELEDWHHLTFDTYEAGKLTLEDYLGRVVTHQKRPFKDLRAGEAVALFCYRVKEWIGAFAAALGGLDTLVFAGGTGENAPTIRARICDRPRFLGIELNEDQNAANESVTSVSSGQVVVRVIRTNEALMKGGLPCLQSWPRAG